MIDRDAGDVTFDSDLVDVRLDRHPSGTAFMETTHDAIALIAQMLPHARPTRERVAKRLNLSARTLQRRLNGCGVTFEDLVDDYRRDHAFRLLTGPGTILEIAYAVGYSDPAHFTRAFKRWTGINPRAYRSAFAAGLVRRPVETDVIPDAQHDRP